MFICPNSDVLIHLYIYIFPSSFISIIIYNNYIIIHKATQSVIGGWGGGGTLTLNSHCTHIQLTFNSHSNSHSTHIQLTFNSHSTHIQLTFNSHSTHIQTHIQLTFQLTFSPHIFSQNMGTFEKLLLEHKTQDRQRDLGNCDQVGKMSKTLHEVLTLYAQMCL